MNNKGKIVATIEARMNSSRLSKKMSLELFPGLNSLAAVIKRLSAARRIDEIVVATTTHPLDDELADIARACGVAVFRGSETDVLGRVVGAGQAAGANALVLVTGDCSCISPRLLDEGVDFFLRHPYDLVTNCLEETYPVGIDLQVARFSALERAYAMARQAPHCADTNNFEHTNYFMRTHSEIFSIYRYPAPERYRRPDVHLALDTEVDLRIIRAIYARLYPRDACFDIDDILDLIKKEPDIMKPLEGAKIDRTGIKYA